MPLVDAQEEFDINDKYPTALEIYNSELLMKAEENEYNSENSLVAWFDEVIHEDSQIQPRPTKNEIRFLRYYRAVRKLTMERAKAGNKEALDIIHQYKD